jgi:hypothetical protein
MLRYRDQTPVNAVVKTKRREMRDASVREGKRLLNQQLLRTAVCIHYLSVLANALSSLPLATFALAQRLLGEHPPADPLGLPLLAELRLGDPTVLLFEMILSCEGSGAANVYAPCAHTLEGVLLGEHMQVPQCQGRGELDVASRRVRTMGGEADGCRCLEEAKEWGTCLCVDCCWVDGSGIGWAAAAHTQEFDLGHDEAVAATVLAHHAMQMCETLKVQDLLGRRLAAHACVPLVVALDKPDDAATAFAEDGLLVVGGVVRDELRLCASTRHGLDSAHDHVGVTLGHLERGIDLIGIVVGANIVKGGLVLWLHALTTWLGKVRGRKRHLQKRQNRGDGLDGGDVEVVPAAEVADVPPEVVVDPSWCACDAADQARGRVARRKVLHQRGRSSKRWEAVKADICERRVLNSWRRLILRNGELRDRA